MINMAWLMRMYPAFQHAGFRLYFVGAIIGMLGAWTEITAQQWLVYKLTDSAILLGLVGATTFLPTLLFSLHAGAIIDRYDGSFVNHRLFSMDRCYPILACACSCIHCRDCDDLGYSCEASIYPGTNR